MSNFDWVVDLLKNENFAIPAFIIIIMFLVFRSTYKKDKEAIQPILAEIRKAYQGSLEQIREHNKELQETNLALQNRVNDLEKKIRKEKIS